MAIPINNPDEFYAKIKKLLDAEKLRRLIYPFPQTYITVGSCCAPSHVICGIDPAYREDEQAGMVPLNAKPVPVVIHKPFPDVLGFTDHPMAPLV
jgi:hypothetical protein